MGNEIPIFLGFIMEAILGNRYYGSLLHFLEALSIWLSTGSIVFIAAFFVRSCCLLYLVIHIILHKFSSPYSII